MSAEYKKAWERYRALATGDATARKDKAKAMQHIREIERASAREGKVLTAIPRGDSFAIETKEVPSKRSLQEEYVRKFDDEKLVNIGGKEQTLRQHHSKRLLGR